MGDRAARGDAGHGVVQGGHGVIARHGPGGVDVYASGSMQVGERLRGREVEVSVRPIGLGQEGPKTPKITRLEEFKYENEIKNKK